MSKPVYYFSGALNKKSCTIKSHCERKLKCTYEYMYCILYCISVVMYFIVHEPAIHDYSRMVSSDKE